MKNDKDSTRDQNRPHQREVIQYSSHDLTPVSLVRFKRDLGGIVTARTSAAVYLAGGPMRSSVSTRNIVTIRDVRATYGPEKSWQSYFLHDLES